MKRFAAVLLAVFVGGCASGGGPKPPGPTPSPSPTARLLLSVRGADFVDQAGNVVRIRSHSECCFSQDPEPDPAWSLTTPERLDWLKSRVPNMLLHVRYGPWTPQSDFPQALQNIGGPYLMVNGKADLMQWNPKYWAYVELIHSHAATNGQRLEDDFVDGWGCKMTPEQMERISPSYHPWIAKNNVQNLDAYSLCGKVEIKANGDEVNQVYERWVRKIVEHAFKDPSGNATGQDGNEIILVPGYTQAWTAGLINVAHDEEAKRGYKRHIFATNAAQTSAVLPQVDYVTVHTASPVTDAICGGTSKPCVVNEYNPSPPFTAVALQSLACDAEAKHKVWGFWRHGMSLAEAEKAWQLLGQPCTSVVTGCTDIPDVGAAKIEPVPASRYTEEINTTLDVVAGTRNGPINEPMQPFLLRFAQALRERYPSKCAGIQTNESEPGLVDQVSLGEMVPGANRADEVQNFHIFNCLPITKCDPTKCDPDDPDCCCNQGTAKPAPQAAADSWRRP